MKSPAQREDITDSWHGTR